MRNDTQIGFTTVLVVIHFSYALSWICVDCCRNNSSARVPVAVDKDPVVEMSYPLMLNGL